MKIKIEANTLQEAYTLAAKELDCSAADVHLDIIVPPRAGILGFFKKIGVFEASNSNFAKKDKKKKREFEPKTKVEKPKNFSEKKSEFRVEKPEIKQEKPEFKPEDKHEKSEPKDEPEKIDIKKELEMPRRPSAFEAYDSIVDNFNKEHENIEEKVVNSDVLAQIKSGLDRLFAASCFKISVVEVSKFDEKTVFIKLDGEDCALLIGKEGYRYKAISYLLYNWINSKFEINIRLEIAEFLKNQENSVATYLQDIIQKVEANGKAHTKPLDGVLVKIALEQLRARFPDKYVGIKSSDEGRYVVVSEFFKK